MPRHAFLIAGDRLVHIANASGAATQYQATEQVMLPGARTQPRLHEHAETVIAVEAGQIDVMINGAVGQIGAGGFARVPAGVWYAMRNDGIRPARLLVRTAPTVTNRTGCNVTLRIAAA